jgi:hypothetical protein
LRANNLSSNVQEAQNDEGLDGVKSGKNYRSKKRHNDKRRSGGTSQGENFMPYTDTRNQEIGGNLMKRLERRFFIFIRRERFPKSRQVSVSAGKITEPSESNDSSDKKLTALQRRDKERQKVQMT